MDRSSASCAKEFFNIDTEIVGKLSQGRRANVNCAVLPTTDRSGIVPHILSHLFLSHSSLSAQMLQRRADTLLVICKHKQHLPSVMSYGKGPLMLQHQYSTKSSKNQYGIPKKRTSPVLDIFSENVRIKVQAIQLHSERGGPFLSSTSPVKMLK